MVARTFTACSFVANRPDATRNIIGNGRGPRRATGAAIGVHVGSTFCLLHYRSRTGGQWGSWCRGDYCRSRQHGIGQSERERERCGNAEDASTNQSRYTWSTGRAEEKRTTAQRPEPIHADRQLRTQAQVSATTAKTRGRRTANRSIKNHVERRETSRNSALYRRTIPTTANSIHTRTGVGTHWLKKAHMMTTAHPRHST